MRGWSRTGSSGPSGAITVDGPLLYPYEPLCVPCLIPDAFVEEYDEIRSRLEGGPLVTGIYPLAKVPFTKSTSTNVEMGWQATTINGLPLDTGGSTLVGCDIRERFNVLMPSSTVLYPNKVATPYSNLSPAIAWNKDKSYICTEMSWYIIGVSVGGNEDGYTEITVPLNPSVKTAFSGDVSGGVSIMKQNRHYAQTGGTAKEMNAWNEMNVRGIYHTAVLPELRMAYRQGDVLHVDTLYDHTLPTKGSCVTVFRYIGNNYGWTNRASTNGLQVKDGETHNIQAAIWNVSRMYRGDYPLKIRIRQHSGNVKYFTIVCDTIIGAFAGAQTTAGRQTYSRGIFVLGVPGNPEYPNQIEYPTWNEGTP